MTTPATPFDSVPRLRLPDPGRLLAALPALLGFPPRRSLLLLCVDPSGMVDAIVRVDLGPAVAVEVTDAIGRLCRCPDAAVIAIVVDDRVPAPDGRNRTLVRSVHDRLDRRGIDLAAAFGSPAIEAGATWHALLGPPLSGTVADPRECPVALSLVLDGRVLHGSRAELVAELERDKRRCGAIVAELARAARPRRPRARDALHSLLAAVRDSRPGTPCAPDELAGVSHALTLVAVRDVGCALAVGELADRAEWLWLELVRSLPDSHRAAPATLLGYSAYARGAGPLAGIALGVALDADPGYRLARMLDRALREGMRPDAIRDLARSGFAVAGRLGVALPPPISEGW